MLIKRRPAAGWKILRNHFVVKTSRRATGWTIRVKQDEEEGEGEELELNYI